MDPARRLTAKPQERWSGCAVVYGPAASQGSKRIGRAGKSGKSILIDTDKRLKPWRSELIAAMQDCLPEKPLDEAVWVRICISVPRPRAHFGTGRNADLLKPNVPVLPATGRDVDKVARACFDAGTAAGWWRDDSRIACVQITRVYGPELVSVEAGSAEAGWQPLPERVHAY